MRRRWVQFRPGLLNHGTRGGQRQDVVTQDLDRDLSSRRTGDSRVFLGLAYTVVSPITDAFGARSATAFGDR